MLLGFSNFAKLKSITLKTVEKKIEKEELCKTVVNDALDMGVSLYKTIKAGGDKGKIMADSLKLY